MKLEEILSKYELVRLATPADSNSIIKYLKSIPMKMGSISIRYDFQEDLWNFLNLQGDKVYVFIIIENNKICGYTVISVRNYYIMGTPHKAGYLSDLRISSLASRKAKIQWKECVNDVFSHIKEVEEFQTIDYFYAAVFEKNEKALKLFNSKKFPLEFHSLASYQAISILGRKPLKLLKPSLRSSKYKFCKATEADKDQLRSFLHTQNKKKFWGEYFCSPPSNEADEWKRREAKWKDLDINNFIIVRDSNEEIIFSVLPWSPKKSRKLIIEEIGKLYIILGKLFKYIGKKELKINSPLNNYYLTHFEISHSLGHTEKHEIFSNFLNYLYKTKFQRNYHSIIFCDYYDNAIEQVLTDYITFKTPAKLYQILPKECQLDKIKISNDHFPQMTFEAAIV